MTCVVSCGSAPSVAEAEPLSSEPGGKANSVGDRLAASPADAPAWPIDAESDDPFDDFEEDDFDDEFDDDFEEDWEDDLTEDDEFPDTFGGADEPDEDEPAVPGEEEEESPFADDPDFDDA